jgi:hypothetical protein
LFRILLIVNGRHVCCNSTNTNQHHEECGPASKGFETTGGSLMKGAIFRRYYCGLWGKERAPSSLDETH